jgi:hypothetical protein
MERLTFFASLSGTSFCMQTIHWGGYAGSRFVLTGKKFPPQRIFFVLHDQWIGIDQIPMISDIWWMLREEASIYVKQDDEIIFGTHNVECIMEISLHTNTRTIDRHDMYPRLVLNLQSEMCTI